MLKIIMIYSTTDGQTKRIIDFLEKICGKKHEVRVVSVQEAHKQNLIEFDKIVIGARVRYGKHHKDIYKFIEKNKSKIIAKNNYFFSVNLVARKKAKNNPKTNPYTIKFLRKTDWNPSKINVFAGRVDYPKYNFINKLIIRTIMSITSGPTDTSRCFEFTDWVEVEKFGNIISRDILY